MLRQVFSDRYAKVFGNNPWAPWIGGLLLGMTNVLLFAYAEPWTTFLGVLNWGQHLLNWVGFYGEERDIFPLLLYPNSILNLSLVLGAAIAALFSRQFGFRSSPPWEMFKAVVGGAFMGIGANLSLGCNIGGFFSAVSALSLGGVAMMGGLAVGAYLGIRYLLWETEHLPLRWIGASPAAAPAGNPSSPRSWQPVVGGILALLALGLSFLYDRLHYPKAGVFLLFGVFLGLVNQRSRFCFVKAFREPFLTGEGSMTRGVILGLMIGVIGFSVIKWASIETLEDRLLDGVRGTFWMGGLLGGVIFGFGMSLTGGCASGSLWRLGEGHLRLGVALLAFAVVGALFNHWLMQNELMAKLGEPVFFPDLVGWKAALLITLGGLGLFSLLITWNEVKRIFTLM
ncbi:MAG: hypothetical protein D6681_13915 [Calditrichaeota bacterium]|nr:MAG: hypothetical protein D6681_13915 [Calditrichota bacterium]